MKRILLLISTAVALGTLILWASGGFHTGWTQTRIPTVLTDEITGIEYTTYEKGFIAGVDVLGGGLVAAALIAAAAIGISSFQKRKAS